MRNIRLALTTFAITAASSAWADSAPEMDGVWMRNDGNARVSIAPCGANVCATNLWIRDTSKGENVGDQLIMTLSRKTDQTLSGKAYDPKRHLTYAITVQVAQDSLSTKGCVLGGLLCKGVTWARVGR